MGHVLWTVCYGLAGLGGFVVGRLRRRPAHPWLTPVGYSLFALTLCILGEHHVSAYRKTSPAASEELARVQQWLPSYRITARSVTVTERGDASYYEVREGLRLRGYVFRSEAFTRTVYGYGGPMALIVFVQPDGTLVDYQITRSYETPRYIRWLSRWLESLKGRTVYGSTSIDTVHAVSGATLTSRAVLRLLRGSGEGFATSVLGHRDTAEATPRPGTRTPDWPVMYSVTTVVLTLVAVYHGQLWSRVVVLIYVVAVGGFELNRQYSMDHVLRLLRGQDLLDGSPAALWLLLAVPIIVLFVGNIYCGYLCPFGAVQELAGFIVPARFKARLTPGAVRGARFIKYALLFIFIAASLSTSSEYVLDADPLALFFNTSFWTQGLGASPGLITALAVVVGSLLVTRLWCRYLCPAGAFLSLLNRAAWLRRWLPPRRIGRCEFGLNGLDQLDCIYCDRCRYDNTLIPERGQVITRSGHPAATVLFLVAIVYLVVFILTPIVERTVF